MFKLVDMRSGMPDRVLHPFPEIEETRSGFDDQPKPFGLNILYICQKLY